jgi:hypothetical protein
VRIHTGTTPSRYPLLLVVASTALLVTACNAFSREEYGTILTYAEDAPSADDATFDDVPVIPPPMVQCGGNHAGCNPVYNLGCDPGMACYYSSATTGMCRPPGTGTAGTACGDASDCLPGLACYSSSPNGARICSIMCCSLGDSSRCTDPQRGGHADSQCRIPIPGAGYFSCTIPCNYYAQDCSSTQTCTVTTSSGVFVTCTPAGPVPHGGSCTSDECGRGMLCARTVAGQPGRCSQVCDPRWSPGADAGAEAYRACPDASYRCAAFASSPAHGLCVPR